MSLEDFLATEQAGGRTVSEDAAFTLNPAQVRVRVATFCQEERLYPLFRCLQGILRVTQSDLFLRYDNDRWTASFLWSEPPSSKQFQSYLFDGITQGFDHVSHAATQHFYFGFSAALGLPHYRLQWRTPQDGFSIGEGKFSLNQESHPEYCQLSFGIEAGWWSRLRGAQRQKSDTEQELRRRLCYSQVPVHIEGERLQPVVPVPPDRPWASRLTQGSNLAWRYLLASSGSRLRPPEVLLDCYRVGKKGKVWHLIKDRAEAPLPLSVQFTESEVNTPPEGPPRPGGSDETLCHSALFLSLQAGRQDWLFPVRDGLLLEPMPISVSQGGVLVITADEELRYDLSGLRVVDDQRLEKKLSYWQKEAKALKSELRLSIANSTLRAETMPSQYYQASGYAFGGPLAGVIAGKVGPTLQKLFSKKSRPRD